VLSATVVIGVGASLVRRSSNILAIGLRSFVQRRTNESREKGHVDALWEGMRAYGVSGE
jgi:hypothetical protein